MPVGDLFTDLFNKLFLIRQLGKNKGNAPLNRNFYLESQEDPLKPESSMCPDNITSPLHSANERKGLYNSINAFTDLNLSIF